MLVRRISKHDTLSRQKHLLPTLSRAHCMLMNDPLLCSVEYENAMYPAAVQSRFAVRPRNAPAAMGNHSCAVLVTDMMSRSFHFGGGGKIPLTIP